MKILLVVPFQNIEPYILPNLGLGYVASAMKKNNHDVMLLDCLKEAVDAVGWRKYLQKGQYDLVGIQMYSYTHDTVKEMLHAAKDVLGDVVTVVGGPHANALPEQILQDNAEIDYVIHGEGEKALPELAVAIQHSSEVSLSHIKNLAWRKADQVIVNDREFIENLDELGIPAWELMHPNTYPVLSHGLLNRAHPIAPIFTSRGCPYGCTFCSAHRNMGAKIRYRTPSKIVDEIELLVNKYGVKEVHFEDDNFTFKKEFASEVCQSIIDRKIRVHWACPNGVRLDSLDVELLQLMEHSGCYSFALGIESGSDRVLRLMRKGTKTQAMREKIRLIAENTKIRMTGFFIFGFPGETEEDLRQTTDLIMNEPLHRISGGPFVPLPGTKIFSELVAEKKIPDKYDWNLLSPYEEKNIFVSGTIGKMELLKYIHNIHLKFYLRPRVMFGILRELHSFEQIKTAFKMLLLWLGVIKFKK